MLANQDVSVSIQTATNAVENNLLPALLLAGVMAYEAYDIYHTLRHEGPQAALIKLGFTIGTAIVGGVVIKNAFKLGTIAAASAEEAFLAYKQANPVFASFFDKAAAIATRHASKLQPVGEKYNQANAYLNEKVGQGFGKAKQLLGGKSTTSSVAEGRQLTTATTTTSTSSQKGLLTTDFSKQSINYIRDMEARSNIPIQPQQRAILKETL